MGGVQHFIMEWRVPITVFTGTFTFASDDPDKKYLVTVREFTDFFFWNIAWGIVTRML